MNDVQPAAIGVDIGGTKIAAGIVTQAGDVLLPRSIPTPVMEGPEAVLDAIIGQVAALLRDVPDQPVQAVGIGTAGMVDADTGVIMHANQHLPGWAGMRLGERVRSATGLSTYVDNDVNVLAVGEGRFGSGQGFREVLYAAVGTGIGGAIVRHGDIWRGTHFGAGEIGYLVSGWDEQGRPINVEDQAGGIAMQKRYQMLAKRAEPVSLRQVAEQARAGDELAARVIREGAALLGYVLGSLIVVLDPEIVIIGGGVPTIGDLWWQPFEQALRRDGAIPTLQAVQLAPARLSTHAGLVGAAALALNAVDA